VVGGVVVVDGGRLGRGLVVGGLVGRVRGGAVVGGASGRGIGRVLARSVRGRARAAGRSGAVVVVVLGGAVVVVLGAVVVVLAGVVEGVRRGGAVVDVDVDDDVDEVDDGGGSTMAVEPPRGSCDCGSCSVAAGAPSSVARPPPQAASRPGTARAKHAIAGRRGTVHLRGSATSGSPCVRRRRYAGMTRDVIEHCSQAGRRRCTGGSRPGHVGAVPCAAVKIPKTRLGLAAVSIAAGAAASAIVLPVVPVGAQPGPSTVTEMHTIAPGVRHSELEGDGVSTERPVIGDLLEVDLRNPRVSLDLLYPGAVADRRPVSQLADTAGAVAAVNGDFFNINETNAPVGPAIAGGRDLKGPVPVGQRFGPGAPGLSTEDVFGVGTDRVGRLDRLALRGAALTPDGPIRLDGLNQYAIRVGGIGAFTQDWGTASRTRSTCGTDTDRSAPCSENTTEVVVDRGVVASVGDEPGAGAIPRGSVVLVGREGGADVLRDELEVGERVRLQYDLVPTGRRPFAFAVGAPGILRDGQPLAGLDDTALAPRTSAGVSADGKRLYLLTVDGRSEASQGLTLLELADLMRRLGADDAVNLDGGGSSTLVARDAGDRRVTVENVPSDGAERPVPNAVGVFVRR
jgi:hypothetical protein